MKILISVILSIIASSLYSQDFNAYFNKANNYYLNNQFDSAITYYELITNAEHASFEVFFNLGNAYYKTNRIAKSILNYERAYKLNPSCNDLNFNLAFVNQHTTDKIEKLPELFFITWYKVVRDLFKPDTWSIISLFSLILSLSLILAFLLLKSIIIRQLSISVGFMVFIVFIISTTFAINSNNILQSVNTAIITSPSAIVKSSPDASGNDLFIIHEGTKVIIKETFDNWAEIVIADGNTGWIQIKEFEVI